jgi:hypothetical protein
MRTKTDKYPNGYANKIEYWQGRFNDAVTNCDVQAIDKAAESLKYFIEKQTLWVFEKIKAKQEAEMSTDKGEILKVWCESSYDFEDTEMEGDEYLVIAVDMGSEGTKTIGSMDIKLKEAADAFAEIFNAEKFVLAK